MLRAKTAAHTTILLAELTLRHPSIFMAEVDDDK
jgi:hypothetical protein